ncbi:ParA family protein [Pseudonocardia nematodicida]|uniref:ParA family protein n=1 Tax=Pseudonocardia nematodicida TaxID=1206997 RepID=A0ABV1K8G7_9PSEU
MQIVSVLNHKGGVGKTTLTANLGAGLAARGKKVLLIDLDPQASLSLSFFTSEEWSVLAGRTIKDWLVPDSGLDDMKPLISSPPRVNDRLGFSSGYLDMIVADNDLDQFNERAIARTAADPSTFAEVHDRLRHGLSMPAMAEYDIVLLDCSPGFDALGRSAVAACDLLLIPTRPDYLSTNGIQSLGKKIVDFVATFNSHRGKLSPVRRPAPSIVFTMVQMYGGRPIADQRPYMAQVVTPNLPAFESMMSDSKSVYGPAPNHGVPVVLGGLGRAQTRELREIVTELTERLENLVP